MSERPSPTPSEDNRRNVREETAIMAIEKALKNMEQSREDLLNSFTSLNKADVEKPSQMVQGKKKINHGSMKDIMASILSKGQASRQSTTLPIATDQKDRRERRDETNKVDADGIEEEILDTGSVEGRLATARVIKVGSSLKVDNFIEDTDDSLNLQDNYVSSFGEDNSRISKRAGSNAKSGLNINTLEERRTLNESDTDRLLMNFLADLQNEENSHKGQKLTERTNASSENSIDTFIKKNQAQAEVVDFSEDGDEAALALVDNSQATNMAVVMKHEDLAEITKPDSDETSPPKSKTRMVMDSEGNISEDQSDFERTCTETREESVIASKTVFPGEIVSEETFTQGTNDRLLEFKVVYKDPKDDSPVTSPGDTKNTHSDEVEPFVLDQDFDYDNVILTPKYSVVDMERLQNLIQTAAAQT